MSEESKQKTFTGIINREFVIDWNKVNSLDDFKEILKAMDMRIFWYNDKCPEQFREIYNRGMLIEKIK